ncbi:MAG: phosphate ABC transporter substrate-binding protein [Deltaproteobacteria bacterium]|nr:phosphate ABC transporter substrate-binding protein [Deltaproteobacteria bacterium]
MNGTKIRLLILLLIFGLFCLSCGRGGAGAGKDQHTVTIAGSTSVMPFTEKLAEYFMLENPDYIVEVQGGGSTAGVQACMNYTVDIGMSSRHLKDNEKALTDVTICNDGIAIVVNPGNPLDTLTIEQIRGIFNGRIKNWKDLGWIDREIDAVSREEGSGTRGSFEDLIMNKLEIDDGIMVQDSNGSVKEVIATDPYAIGYISLGLLDGRVKGLAVNGVSPTMENIKSGDYEIVRPFLYLTNGEPDECARTFIDFVLSMEGQTILQKEGLIDIL